MSKRWKMKMRGEIATTKPGERKIDIATIPAGLRDLFEKLIAEDPRTEFFKLPDGRTVARRPHGAQPP